MAAKAKPRTQWQPTFGIVSITENRDGTIKVNVDIEPQETSSEETINKIKSIVAGMAYYYERNEEVVEAVGSAYLEGMEVGLRQNRPQGNNGGTPVKMGFPTGPAKAQA